MSKSNGSESRYVPLGCLQDSFIHMVTVTTHISYFILLLLQHLFLKELSEPSIHSAGDSHFFFKDHPFRPTDVCVLSTKSIPQPLLTSQP